MGHGFVYRFKHVYNKKQQIKYTNIHYVVVCNVTFAHYIWYIIIKKVIQMAMINANVTTFKFNNSLKLFTVHAHSFYNTSINQYENPMVIQTK